MVLHSIFAVFVTTLLLSPHASGQQQRGQPGWPCVGTVDPTFVSTAEATGGVVMLLKPTEIAGSAVGLAASDQHKEVVFRATGTVADGAYDYEIPLDSTIESAYFYLAMQCLRDAALTDPSGDELRADAEGVQSHRFEAVRLFTIAKPAPGLWKVSVAGRGFFSVIVRAKSDLQLASVTVTDSTGAPDGAPKRQRLEVTIKGEATDLGFRLLSAAAASIGPLELALEKESDSESTYAGEVTPPTGSFRVAMTGIDASGFRFQRVDRRLTGSER